MLTVAYHSDKSLQSFAADLNNQTCQPDMWLIVNNSPVSQGPIELNTSCDLLIINGLEGEGFANGCNRGLEFLDSQEWRGWIWIINPDIWFPDIDVIKKLISYLKSSPQNVLLGTSIIDQNHALEPSAGWISSWSNFRSNRVNSDLSLGDSVQVDWVSGCSLLLKPSELNFKPKFEEQIPLYYEDIDFCIRLASEGIHIIFFSFGRFARKSSFQVCVAVLELQKFANDFCR